jgi:hypothetical protein
VGAAGEIQIHRNLAGELLAGGQMFAGDAAFRFAPRQFQLQNLTADQYHTYRRLTPRRLLQQAGGSRRRNTVGRIVGRIDQLFAAVRNSLALAAR